MQQRLNIATRSLLEQVQTPVYWLDASGVIIFTNRLGADLTQAEPSTLIGKHIDTIGSSFIGALLREALMHVEDQQYGQMLYTLPVSDDKNTYLDVDIHKIVVDNQTTALLYIRDVSDKVEQRLLLQENRHFLTAIINNSPAIIFVKDTEGRYTLVNQRWLDIFGFTEVLGQTDLDLFPPEIANEIRANDARVIASQTVFQYEETLPQRDGVHTYLSIKFPVFTEEGVLLGLCGIANDITTRVDAERKLILEQQQERLLLQEQVIEAQKSVLKELSTPLLSLADGVVVLPLVGMIDTARAEQIMETMLDGVIAYHANVAIIDISGVKVVDSEIANMILRVARAVQLLGARMILSGINPEIAQTFVHIGADLSSMGTFSQLQAAISYALK